MNLRSQRKALGLSLQAAADLISATREAVRLAEAGEAPNAAAKLTKAYSSKTRVKARRALRDIATARVVLELVRRGDDLVLHTLSQQRPFAITATLIDGFLEGFNRGSNKSASAEL